MVATFLSIFSQGRYVVLASLVSWVIFSLIMWLPNTAAIATVWQSHDVWALIVFLLSLYAGVFTVYSWFTGLSVLLLSVLLGVQLALLMHFIRSRQATAGTVVRVKLLSVGSTVAAAFGIGCAACGSLLLSSLLATVGGAAFMLWLPLHGGELSVIAVAVLLYSCWRLLREIGKVSVCPIE
jgi:hypothetical protein